MEDRKFDELTKKLAAPVSRRTALKAAVVTAIGGAFGLGKLTGAEAQTAPCVGSRAVACAAGQVCCTNPQALGMYGRCMSCPPGKVPNNFCQCVCPTGTTACGPGCVSPCPSGQVLNTQTCACTCGPGKTSCPGPNGTHTCVSTPSCPAGQFLDTTCTCQCSGSQPCGPGVCCAPGTQNCVNGTCASVCSSPISDACSSNLTCAAGACNCYTTVDATAPTGCFTNDAFCSATTGTACATNLDCPLGQICKAGACAFCSTNADCPAGQTCAVSSGGFGSSGNKVCTCSSSSQCLSGSACIFDYCCDGLNYCVPFCPAGARPTKRPGR